MLSKFKYIFAWILIVVFVISFIYVGFVRVTGEIPGFFGYSLHRINSESMEPELSIGEIILVKEVEPSELQKGDVITYTGEKGPVANEIVTRQIVEEPYEKDGLYYFTTRGIKSGSVNDPQIDDTQIIGQVKLMLPFIGMLYDFFSKWYGIAIIIAILIVIYYNDIINLIHKFKGDEEDNDSDVPANAPKPEYDYEFTEALEKEAEEVITDLDGGF